VLINIWSDLEFIDTHFGDMELLASDHLDVVNAQSVECEYNFSNFLYHFWLRPS